MESDTKKPWQSKTIIVNAVLGLAAVVAMFTPEASGVSVFVQAHGDAIGLFWGVLNIVLRAITKDKIALRD